MRSLPGFMPFGDRLSRNASLHFCAVITRLRDQGHCDRPAAAGAAPPSRARPEGRPGGGSQRQRAKAEAPAAAAGALAAAFPAAALAATACHHTQQHHRAECNKPSTHNAVKLE